MERTARYLSLMALAVILALARGSLTKSLAEPADASALQQPPSPPPTSLAPTTPPPPTSPPPAPVVRRFEARVARARSFRPTATTPAPAPRPPDPPAADVWARLRDCESGGRYDANTGNGYFGAYQFHPGTWRNLGFSGLPHQAAPEVQDEAARRLQARSGWGQWPACSRRIGAR